MKDKRLELAPKVRGNSQMKNMRPISLYEVIRKVWTTTIAKRVHRVLHEAGVLYGAQSGYQLDQGTRMLLLQVINQINGAIHSDTSKHITFWNIRRAFNSISRNLRKLTECAWECLREWFIQLDDDGLFFINTPLYANTSNLHSHKDMLKRKKHMTGAKNIIELSFEAERGIVQEESASSLQ
jgi:hypothetical protein